MTTAKGLLSERMICVPESQYQLANDHRYLIPYTQNGKYGLMTRDGKIVATAQYDVILDTARSSKDLIRIGQYMYRNYEQTNGEPRIYCNARYGLIDTRGRFLIPKEYKGIVPPYKSSQVYVVEHPQKGHGVIDLDGNEIVLFGKYAYIWGFARNHAKVKTADNKYGIINDKGKEVLPCVYSNIWNFYQKDWPTAIVESERGQEKFDFVAEQIIGKGPNTHPQISGDEVEGLWDEPYGSHYGEYAGSYAQDVEGYSDDVIDDAFDGDPEAYWNID